MDEINYPWVKKGEKLFIPNAGYFQKSHFGWGTLSSQLYGYISGYKESADSLVKYAINSTDISTLDTFVFPICFLYRHCLELMLKSVFLQYSSKNREEKIAFIKNVSHKLKRIWDEVKPIVLKYSYKEEQNDVEAAEEYIVQFDEFDEDSFSFRYPMTKRLKVIHDEYQYLNLENLKDRMTELCNFFDGVENAIGERMSADYEMLNYISGG